MADTLPGDPPDPPVCACAPPAWDQSLKLWRAKCQKVTIHPISGKSRKSAHESFHPGLPGQWTCVLVIPPVSERHGWAASLRKKRDDLMKQAALPPHSGAEGIAAASVESTAAAGSVKGSAQDSESSDGVAAASGESTASVGNEQGSAGCGVSDGTSQNGVAAASGESTASMGNEQGSAGCGVSDGTSQNGVVTAAVESISGVQNLKGAETPEKKRRKDEWDKLEEEMTYIERIMSLFENYKPVTDGDIPSTPKRRKKNKNEAGDNLVMPDKQIQDEMLNWAEKVAQPKVYLEFPDLFLVAATHGIDLEMFSWGEGEKRFVKAFDMIKSVVPGFFLERPLDSTEQYAAVAVFCPADFQANSPHARLNHWVPALKTDHLETPDAFFAQWARDAQKAGKNAVEELERRRPGCLDDDERLSLDATIRLAKLKCENFLKMQKDLFCNHQLLVQNVLSDGNCGAYVCLSLIKDVDPSTLGPADSENFRSDLRELWYNVASDPMWQSVWKVLRSNLNSGEEAKKETPKGKKGSAKDRLPFTPEKVGGNKRRLVPGCKDDYHQIVVPGQDDAPEAESKPKKKRTGKPLPPSETIHFSAYFARYLSGIGLTYKSWIQFHRKKSVVLRSGEVCPNGQWLQFSESLASGNWPDDCPICVEMLESFGLDKAALVQKVRRLHEQVVEDLQMVAEHGSLKPLKRKPATPIQDGPPTCEATIKSECTALVAVKKELETPETSSEWVDRWEDRLMNKTELARFHHITILPHGHMQKKYPAECKHCSKLIQAKNRAKLWQHVSGQDHRAKWSEFMRSGGKVKKEEGPEPGPLEQATSQVTSGECKGLRLNGEFGVKTRIGSDLRDVFEEFATYHDLSILMTPNGEQCKTYEKHFGNNDWTIRDGKCSSSGTIVHQSPGGDVVCQQCFEGVQTHRWLSKISSVVYDLDAARLLFHKMFATEKVDDFISALKAKSIYTRRCRTQYDRLFELPLPALHSQVRKSWWGRLARKMNPAIEAFYSQTVVPCLECEPNEGLKERYLQQLLNFMCREPGATARDLDLVKSICTGRLQRHPALHGVIAACTLKLQNIELGKSTFRNPHRSAEEKQLLLEAAAELSSFGANSKSLEFFGLKYMEMASFKGVVCKLREWGLPVMISPSPQEIEQNDHICSTILSRSSTSCQRRMVCAFDRTYLESSLQLFRKDDCSCFAGGVHRPSGFDEKDESIIPIRREDGSLEFDLKDIRRATELESFLLWDGSRPRSCVLEVAAYPVLSSASLDKRFEDLMENPRHQRGKWETLMRTGEFLAHCHSVRFIICDGHGSHEWFHKLLIGQRIQLPDDLMNILPFWSELEFKSLPLTCMPLAWRIPMIHGTSLHYIPGIAHAQKNTAEQLRSVLRTCFFGRLWSDASASVDLGMFPQAFVGSDSMSDEQASLWFNPLHFISNVEAKKFQIPWCLRGAFVFGLIEGHIAAALLHKNVTRKWRLEVAFTGLSLLNLGILMAEDTAKRLNIPLRSLWLDIRTHRTLKDLCGSIIMALWGCEGPICWDTLTERCLEKRFGRVRTRFSTCTMTASDYFRATSVVMRKEVSTFQRNPSACVEAEECLSANSFCQTAQHAFQAALLFSSFCSGRTPADLQDAFHRSHGGETFETELGEEPSDQGPCTQHQHGGEQVASVLSRIRGSQEFLEEGFEEDPVDKPEKDGASLLAEQAARGKQVDEETGTMTEEVLAATPEGPETEVERFFPKGDRFLLRTAIQGHNTFDAAEDDLVRLACYLRMAPRGSEADIVRNPLSTRRLICQKSQKWQNCLRHQLAQAHAQDSLPAHRKSRLSAWVENQEKARKEAVPCLPTCLKLTSGDVVAALVRGEWKVSLILTTWRHLKKGNGAQHCIGEMDRGGLHSARVVVFEAPSEEQKGLFTCNEHSVCMVLPMDEIGLRLDGDGAHRKIGVDGMKIFLPEESMRALEFLKKNMGNPNQEKNPTTTKVRAPAYVQPLPQNFRRTLAGGKLIVQELGRLLKEEARMFPHRAMVSADGSILKYKDSKGEQTQIARDDFMNKAPKFFDCYFRSIRRKLEYSHRVYNWFQSVMKSLKDNGSTSELNSLVAQIAEANLGDTSGVQGGAQIEESDQSE